MALLMVNTLSKDFGDGNPLVRGLALRTMTALQIPYLLEHILPRLKQGLLDVSPYVRKTAAIGCAKLLPIARDHVVTPPILERLHALIDDPDPLVSSNALRALEEMLKEEGGGVNVNEPRVLGLLQRFSQYNSWSQTQILALILKYDPKSQEEVIAVLNLLDPLLKSSNSSVVLSVSNLFLKYTHNFKELHLAVYPRLKDPLVTITSGANVETTYVAMAHLLTLAQRQPHVFADLQRKFYLKSSDPASLKSVKIELLQAISKVSHILQIQELINELAEYAKDKNPAISHLAVHAMTRTIYRGLNSQLAEGQGIDTSKTSPVSMKIAEQVVDELLSLLEINWTCTCDAALAGLKTVLRLYPKFAADVVPKVIGATKLNEGRPTINAVSHAIAEEAYVWILGEFGEKVLEVPYLLEIIVGQWKTLASRVKLQLLESVARLFFVRAPEMRPSLLNVLDTATGDPTNPDVHDKAMFMTRLLATDLALAEHAFRTPSSVVTSFSSDLDPVVQDMLMEEFNTLSILYREPASSFIRSYDLIEREVDITENVPETPVPIHSTTPPPPHSDSTTYPDYIMSNPGSYAVPSHVPATIIATSPAQVQLQPSASTTTTTTPPSKPSVFSTPPSVPELKLGQLKATSAMQSKVFETMWKNLPSAFEETLAFVPRSNNPKDLEASLKDFKIFTVASGVKNASITLFCYAQLDATPAPHVLINISISTSTSKLTLVIKSESKEFAASFRQFFNRVLQEVQ